jgi:hypothetical protein
MDPLESKVQMLNLYEQLWLALGGLTGQVWLNLTSKAGVQNALQHPR